MKLKGALISPASISRSWQRCLPSARKPPPRIRASVPRSREMAARNPTRIHLVEKLEKLVETYNLGTVDVEAFFEALKKLLGEMEEEERRAAREGLTEDELAIFDLLTKPDPKLTKAQEVEAKRIARDLLVKLQDKLSVLDWKAKQQTRADGPTTIRFTLNELPEEPYPQEMWNKKVDAVWLFVFSRSQQRIVSRY